MSCSTEYRVCVWACALMFVLGLIAPTQAAPTGADALLNAAQSLNYTLTTINDAYCTRVDTTLPIESVPNADRPRCQANAASFSGMMTMPLLSQLSLPTTHENLEQLYKDVKQLEYTITSLCTEGTAALLHSNLCLAMGGATNPGPCDIDCGTNENTAPEAQLYCSLYSSGLPRLLSVLTLLENEVSTATPPSEYVPVNVQTTTTMTSLRWVSVTYAEYARSEADVATEIIAGR